MDHGDLRQQTADQDIRAQDPIIGELISIAAASEFDPGRKKRVLFQTCVPYSLGKSGVLTQPVRLRTEDSFVRYGQSDQYEKKKDER